MALLNALQKRQHAIQSGKIDNQVWCVRKGMFHQKILTLFIPTHQILSGISLCYYLFFPVYYMRCIPTKLETSDLLGIISYWYHCKEYTFNFNLIPKSISYPYFLRYDHLCIRQTLSGFSGSVILRNQPLKVSYSYSFGFYRLQKMQNFLWDNV